MIVEGKGFEGEVLFKFYSYGANGADVMIPIYATDADAAWDKFDRIYGKDRAVDRVVKA